MSVWVIGDVDVLNVGKDGAERSLEMRSGEEFLVFDVGDSFFDGLGYR